MTDDLTPPLDESLRTPPGSPSPFLPGTSIQYAWDSTSIGMMKVCPRLYQYVMLEGWSPRDESVHLRFGSEYHKALEEYDKAKAAGLSHDDAMSCTVQYTMEFTSDFAPDESIKAGKYKNRKTLIALIIDYLDHFADDPCQTYILSDGKPAVELSFRFELEWGPKIEADDVFTYGCDPQPYLLCGHLDRVVEFNGDLLVLDHKTTVTTISDYFFRQFEPNNQMTLYTLAGTVILDTPIKGIVIDAAQIMLSEPNRFVRGFTYRTKDQLAEWLDDLKVLLAQAEGYALAGYWPQNDGSCGMYGGCKFRGICSKSPSVRETFLRSDFIKLAPEDRWDPLKNRG